VYEFATKQFCGMLKQQGIRDILPTFALMAGGDKLLEPGM
jgi:hypothetical protein